MQYDVMWRHDERDMWLGKGDRLTLSQHPTKLGAYRPALQNRRRNVSYFSCDITWPHDQRVILLCVWEPVAVKVNTMSSLMLITVMGPKMFLVFYVSSRDHIIKGTHDLEAAPQPKSPLRQVLCFKFLWKWRYV